MVGVIAAALALTSPAFAKGAMIPARYTCDGRNVSPPLQWSHVPPHTQTFALRLVDPDAPGVAFTHWTAWNFVRSTLVLHTGAARRWPLDGTNSFGRVGYGGPCPPTGSTHHYVFSLYALDTRLTLRRGATPQQFAAALRGHVLASARLVARYRRR